MKNREKHTFSILFVILHFDKNFKLHFDFFWNVEKQNAGQQIRENVGDDFLKLSFQVETAFLDKTKKF